MSIYMSRAELEEISEGLITAYANKFSNRVIQSIDIEHFITEFLMLRIEYASFAEDDAGRIGFLADGATPLLIHQDGKIIPFVFPKDTIVLDKFLLAEKEQGRRRFTMAHEASHHILSKMYAMPSEGRFHAEYDSERSYSKEELAQMFASVEWQADTMGASLLMPRRIIENALAKYNQSNPIRVYGDNTITSKDKAVIRRMAAYIGVSYTALVIRLRDMGLFEYHNILEYISNTFVRPVIGSKRISTLKKSDIKKYYNYLVDERNLKPSTIDNIHTVLHQVLQIAVDDDFIRNNPSDNVLRELKKAHCFQSEKRRALTKPEQELFLNFLKTHPVYEHWYPVFAVMIGTGLRVGEVTGLRWCDIDMESGMIDVNHTLVYYDHRTEGSKSGCYFNVNTTKTPASMRQVPMLGFVREAFEQEKQKQEDLGLHCEVTIDGYTDFIFINRFGQAQHQATLNKAIRRIIRDCNDEQFLHSDEPDVLLPHFSCHSLRHTFTTRMCEAGVNIKVIQDALGHSDISTTLNIYADVTKEMKAAEFKGLDSYFVV